MLQTVNIVFASVLSLVIIGTAPVNSSGVVDYVYTPVEGAIVVDTRLDEECSEATLAGARCLPAKDFLAGHKRLANVSGMLWLLGTIGLRGHEHVLVIGDRSGDKEFVAGLLFIAGQTKVSVLIKPLSSMASEKNAKSLVMSQGTSRASTRETVYQASMRDSHIVLRSELAALIQATREPIILDGRSDGEYWGSTIRAARGGHVPGARSLPLRKLRPPGDKTNSIQLPALAEPVVYGHDSYEGLIYLARLVAAGLTPRLYLEGWAGWASDGALPADAVSYAGPSRSLRKQTKKPSVNVATQWSRLVLALFAGMALASGGFWLSQRTTRT